MKGLLFGAGGLAFLLGLLWAGQGTGLFPYPSNSFMLHQMAWGYRGLALFVAGGAVMIWARRL